MDKKEKGKVVYRAYYDNGYEVMLEYVDKDVVYDYKDLDTTIIGNLEFAERRKKFIECLKKFAAEHGKNVCVFANDYTAYVGFRMTSLCNFSDCAELVEMSDQSYITPRLGDDGTYSLCFSITNDADNRPI